MKNIIRITVLAIFILSFRVTQAEDIYIKLDDVCIDQFSYDVLTNGTKTSNFEDFYIRVTDKETSVIRTSKFGVYSKKDYHLSNDVIEPCDRVNKRFFQDIIGTITSGAQRIYFIEEDANSYHIYESKAASYLTFTDDYFFYYKPGLSYKIIYDGAYSPVQDVAVSASKGKVLYSGKSNFNCTDKHYLMVFPEVCCSRTEVELIEGVGFYREISENQEIHLAAINGGPVANFTALVCSGSKEQIHPPVTASTMEKQGFRTKGGSIYTKKPAKPITATTEVAETKKTPATSYTYDPSKNTTKGGSNFTIEYEYKGVKKTTLESNPTPITDENLNTEHIHVVDRGDTLYSLAKKYKTSIEKLMELNNLESHAIYATQQLRIK